MKNKIISQFFISNILILLCSLLLSFTPDELWADCSCTYPQYQPNFIGPEYMAESFVGDPCPSPGETVDYDAIEYKYKNQNNTDCSSNSNGTIRLYSLPWTTEHYYTPAEIEQRRASFYPTYWLLRNKSGTHFLFVHPDYSGTILGINLSSKPKGVYIVEDFNEYCSDSVVFSEPDTDGDGYADCIDCDPNNAAFGDNCPPCQDEMEAQCGSTDNALNWRDDPEEGCIGTCKDKNLGNCP